MKTTKEIAEQVLKGLQAFGAINTRTEDGSWSMPVPCTTNGESYYFVAKFEGVVSSAIDGAFKIRVSDHQCGDRRMLSEVCIYNDTDFDKFIDSIECTLHPERFQKISRVYTNELASDEKAPVDAVEISRRITKKGKTMITYQITEMIQTLIRI